MGINKRKGDVGQAGNAGQWAALQRSESDVAVNVGEGETIESAYERATSEMLEQESTRRVRVVGWSSNAKLQEYVGERPLLTPEEIAASSEYLDEDHLLEHVQRVSRNLCARRGAMEHLDEVVGLSTHDLIKRIRENEEPDRNITAVTTQALVSLIAQGHFSHRISNGEYVSTPTREAQKTLKDRIAHIEQTEDRHVGKRETKEIAEEIRMSFPASRRPDEEFYSENRFARSSIEAPMAGDSGQTLADSLTDSESRSGSDYLDPTSDRALHEESSPYEDVFDPDAMQAPELLWHIQNRDDSEYDITARDSKTSAYNVIAQGRRLPLAVADTVPHRPALAAQKAVSSHPSGAAGVAADYLAGESNEQTEAFFKPFGEIDEDRRRAVAEYLAETPSYADELWQAAMRTADRERRTLELPKSSRSTLDV